MAKKPTEMDVDTAKSLVADMGTSILSEYLYASAAFRKKTLLQVERVVRVPALDLEIRMQIQSSKFADAERDAF